VIKRAFHQIKKERSKIDKSVNESIQVPRLVIEGIVDIDAIRNLKEIRELSICSGGVLSEKELQDVARYMQALFCRGSVLFKSGFPLRHVHRLWDIVETSMSEEWDKVLGESLYDMVNERSSLFVYSGQCGTGKTQMSTYLGAWTLQRVRSQRAGAAGIQFKTAKYTSMQRFNQSLGQIGISSEEYRHVSDLLDWFVRPDFLAIDDVYEDSGIEVIRQIIRERHEAKKVTVITSCEKLDKVLNLLGPDVCSRMEEDGSGYEFTWMSMRWLMSRSRSQAPRDIETTKQLNR